MKCPKCGQEFEIEVTLRPMTEFETRRMAVKAVLAKGTRKTGGKKLIFPKRAGETA